MKPIENELQAFLMRLKHSGLPAQAKRTLKGQALKGDLEGAKKGFCKLSDAHKHTRKEVG